MATLPIRSVSLTVLMLFLGACSTRSATQRTDSTLETPSVPDVDVPLPKTTLIRPGVPVPRQGDEIMVCGQLFRTGAPVVLWLDPDGYDAYRTVPRFAREPDTGFTENARYNTRTERLTTEQRERVRGGGWDLPLLQRTVDQFVIHYDVTGSARTTFKVLHDDRNLSVHFMLDIDGTIYQTMDLKERAWHATKANSRSIGIEIAHIGARAPAEFATLSDWYSTDDLGIRLRFPERMGDGGVRTSRFIGRPTTPEIHRGRINGSDLMQYDFTPEQYESLARLTAALTEIFPELELKYPSDDAGNVLPNALPDDAYANFHGILGHWHVQTDKVDPGPAFNWNALITRVRNIQSSGLTREEIGSSISTGSSALR